MRIRLKGINRVRKRLADGTWETYYYEWKGGPRLCGEPGTPECVASYNEAVARKVTPPRGTLLNVLQQYQASEDFTGLAESTRHDYIGLIRRIEQAFGDFPLSALTDRRTRGLFMAWRDRYAVNSGRRQADYAWTVLARVLSWGLDRGLVLANPCERGGRLYRGTRREIVWTAADEALFLDGAPAHLHLPLLLALLDGAAPGRSLAPGVVRMARISACGRARPARVVIPVGAPLMLRSMQRRSSRPSSSLSAMASRGRVRDFKPRGAVPASASVSSDSRSTTCEALR
jgi:hypothetical protein